MIVHPYPLLLGTVFDVTRKADTYGKGKSYNLFAGKDASRALGMSSLKEEDAVSDYSTLSAADLKTLNDWFDFFSCVSRILFMRRAETHPFAGSATTSSGRSSISRLRVARLCYSPGWTQDCLSTSARVCSSADPIHILFSGVRSARPPHRSRVVPTSAGTVTTSEEPEEFDHLMT